MAPEQESFGDDSSSVVSQEQTQPPQVVELDVLEEVADSAPRSKRARVVAESSKRPEPLSSDDIWALEIMLGLDPISVHHTMLDTLDVEL